MDTAFVRLIGRLTLGVAGLMLFLFISNIRSRIYYNGPNWSFLFWIFLYCAITGVGLVRLKKWAVIALFLPGILFTLIFIYGMSKQPNLSPGSLVTVSMLALLVGIPAIMLRHWNELRWGL